MGYRYLSYYLIVKIISLRFGNTNFENNSILFHLLKDT